MFLADGVFGICIFLILPLCYSILIPVEIIWVTLTVE